MKPTKGTKAEENDGFLSPGQRVALTVVLVQQLHGSEQHGPVLRILDVQLVQVLLFQQLERVQVLVAVEQERGHVLLRDRKHTGGGVLVRGRP